MTGASSGVGWEIGRSLAAGGAELLMPVRDRAKGERMADAIRAAVPGARIRLLDLDLARLDSVRDLVEQLRAEDQALDLLVLNAGVALIGDPARRVTADGYELHFQTNFLAHAALVLGLLPLLERSQARIAVQGSLASALWGVRWDDLQFERRYGPLRAYGSSKTALGLFGVELARRVDGITVGLSHPGVVPDTAIASDVRERVWPTLRDLAVHRLGNRPDQAAECAVLALETGAQSGGGSVPTSVAPSGWLQFAGPARERRPFRRLTDPGDASRVWELAEELLR